MFVSLHVGVIGTVLAQTVALEHYERRVDNMIEIFSGLNKAGAGGGRGGRGGRGRRRPSTHTTGLKHFTRLFHFLFFFSRRRPLGLCYYIKDAQTRFRLSV